ncbi:unnamed protein product [Closterium sp. NIES-54]
MVQQVLQRFDFTYSSPQATPLSTRHSLSALPSDESVEPSGPYPELVGCLMYLMTCTRPDLAYPLSILARYVAPGRHRPEHMAAAKRVLRYLCSTSGLGLVLGGRRPVVLTGHADASWADDQATQRSSQGYTFSLGSGSVSWRSTHSSSVLGSSCEAEIYAGAMAAQELRWLTYLLTDLREPPRSPPVLLCGDFVFHPELALLCLTGLVFLLVPNSFASSSIPHSFTFSSNLLREFCRGEGILQSFTLPDSPRQNGIAERRIGLVMEVARTSMIHAAAPHFLWPFAVQYAAHQLNLWPRVSLPKTSPILRLTGEVDDASVFRVWGSRAFVRDTSADKLSPHAIPCIFLGFVLDAPRWQFYHPTSRRVLPSQDISFNESVPFYRLFPYRSMPPPPPPLFLALGPPPVDPLLPQGPAPSSVSEVDPLTGPAPVQVAVGSCATRGVASGGAESWGAESGGAGSKGAETGGAEPGGVGTGGAEPGGAEPEGVKPGDAASEGAESGGAEPQGAALTGGSAGASPRLSLQQLREWFVRRTRLRSGATRAGGAGDAGPAGARGAGAAGAGGAGAATGASGAGGATATGGTRATGAGGTRAADPCARDPSFESATASALVAELLDFAVACRLDYATAFVVESESASPPSVGGECALSTNVLEDRQENFECLAVVVPRFAPMLLAPEGDPDAPDIPTPHSYAEAITGPYSSQWLAVMDAEMASWKSRGTYVDEVPPPWANIVDGMWIFRVKRPLGSPPAFKALYVA